MYVGFNLSRICYENDCFDDYSLGLKLFKGYSNIVHTKLQSYIDEEGKIDGTEIRNNWFPQIKADIFISHSHRDEKLSISLAGLLYRKFGIKSFIDSCVWGYGDDLLKIIDEYARMPNGNYYYETRNKTTSHIHMLLSTALNMMIDNTECLFFINTPESIIPNEVKLKTFSPWIYSEIVFSQLVRRKSKEFHRGIIQKAFSATDSNLLEENFTPLITHELELEHLKTIDADTINTWIDTYKDGNALDVLYQIVGE